MNQIKNLKFKIKNLNKGFTLIELLIVIAIIGVLATLLMVNFVGVRQRARDAQRKSDLRQLQSAMEIYRSDNGSYPQALGSCNSSLAGTVNGQTVTYMLKIPCDPNGASYYYSAGNGIYTLGACLENIGDSQKDTPNSNVYGCTGTTNWSFTLYSP